MPKGMYSQGLMVLSDGTLAADAVMRALAGFELVRQKPPEEKRSWMGGHHSWLIAMRPEVNGYVEVDLVSAPWPDGMGDPKAGDIDDRMGETMLFGAWRARHFAGTYGEGSAGEAAGEHRGFVRLRSSYIFGADKDAKCLPADYDPRAELEFVTSISRALVRVTGALCFFDPGGETLFSADGLERTLDRCAERHLPPLPVWCGQRLVRLDDQAPGWQLADTVGMEQLLGSDHEAVFQPEKFDTGKVMDFVRSISLYTLEKGPVIRTGHTTNGPDGNWRALEIDQTVTSPPRPVIRWYSDAGPPPPAALMPPGQSPARVPPAMPAPSAQPPSRKSTSSGGIAGRLKSFFGH